MGSAYRGGRTTNPSGQNIDAWCENIDQTAKVRKACLRVGGVNRTDSASTGLRARRGVTGILALVTGGNSEEETLADSGGDTIVGGLLKWPTETQISDSFTNATVAGSVVGGPGDALEHTRV